MDENKICLNCGKKITNKLSKKYCGKICRDYYLHRKRYISKNRVEIRKCLFCNKDFEWNSNNPGKKYCSLECRQNNNIKKKKEQIDIIKLEVTQKVTEIIEQSLQNEDDCEYMVDYRYVGDITQDTRQDVLNRDHNECVICKNKNNLHLHHIRKRAKGGNHDATNLVTLCGSCHRHIEIGDVENAIEKCYKNRINYKKNDALNNLVDSYYILKNTMSEIFEKVSKLDDADSKEILIEITNVLDNCY